jgi:bis(5'-adenosyl)-triphosphatase
VAGINMFKRCCFIHHADEEVFCETKNFYAVYNWKPMVPGHSLAVPKKHMRSLQDLSSAEVAELFELCRKILRAFQKVYKTRQFDLAIQEGKDAGQSIEHLHVHLIPRKPGDLDGEWYEIMAKYEKPIEPAPTKERIRQAGLLRAAMKE